MSAPVKPEHDKLMVTFKQCENSFNYFATKFFIIWRKYLQYVFKRQGKYRIMMY